MKLTRWVVLMPALGLLSSMAVSAYAQPDPAKVEERRKKADENKERRETVRTENLAKRDDVVDRRRALVDAYVAGASPEALHKAADEVVAARKDLQKARQDARAAEVARLNAALAEAGVDVNKGLITVELRIHSMRVAKLARIRELALAANDTALQQRVDQLAAKEDARHKRHMAKLMGGEGSSETEGGTP